MASSQSYGDFERDYNAHLSKVRAFLAQPTTNLNTPQQAANVGQCEKALQEAKQCIHAMTGLAEIEGDPFKSEDAKRKLERDIGPLEEEIRSRKAAGWKQSSGWGATNSTSDQKKLFGIKRLYAPPSMGGDNDMEYGDMSLTAPLTEVERRMRDSEHLLRESQALCAESEQIGASTIEAMGRQREQLERSAGFIQQSLENTEQARLILKEMAYRALKNKMFLYCVIALLILANGAVLLHLWRRKK